MKLAPRVALALTIGSLLCVNALAQPGGTQITGTVESVADNTVWLADGSSFPLADPVRVTEIWPASPADLAPGQFVAISARRLADGTLDASLIAVFPAGAGAGGGNAR